MSGFELLIPIITGGGGGTLAAVGTGLSAFGALAEGVQAKRRFKYEAQQMEQKADEAQAVGQRSAAAKYREGRIVESRQRAVAAASGGGGDQSVINIMGMTQRETDLNARTEMYKAENQAKGYQDAAKVARVNAKNAMLNGILGAGGELASGGSSMYERFNKKSKYNAPSTPTYYK